MSLIIYCPSCNKPIDISKDAYAYCNVHKKDYCWSCDCVSDQSLWPKEVPLTKEEAKNFEKLKIGNEFNFRGVDYILFPKSEKKAKWKLLV